MKKLSFVLLSVSFLTVAFASQARGQANWTTWKNRSHNLEWKMPSDWKVVKNEPGLFFACEPQNAYCIEVGFSKGQTVSVRDLANRFVNNASSQNKTIKWQRHLKAIEGFRSHVLLYTATHAGKAIQTIVLALACKFNDSNAVFSLWWTDHPRYNSVNQEFAEKVARTLRLISSR
jgi:hypothetical protein